MKIDYDFVKEVEDTIDLIIGEYSCFGKVEVQPDPDTVEDGKVWQYIVTIIYETQNAEDIEISFNVCKVEDQPGYVESKFKGDFALNTWEDNWHDVSSISSEVLWMVILDHIEKYYQRELRKKS